MSSSSIDSLLALIRTLFLFFLLIIVARMLFDFLQKVMTLYVCEIIIILNPAH